MDELKVLIQEIQTQYDYINDDWKNNVNYFPLNMKQKKVDDVYKDDKLLLHVFNYRKFINDNISDILKNIDPSMYSNVINSRVKALNSIQYKIQNYETNHENGKIPLKKCLNDILGFRIIISNDLDFGKTKKTIEACFPGIKCIISERGKYKAIHVYFGNNNNMNFQWELQVWDKIHEKSNLESHAKYKQDYTKWEHENI